METSVASSGQLAQTVSHSYCRDRLVPSMRGAVSIRVELTLNVYSDGSLGVGQQMAALEVVQANLISSVPGIVTNTTGGMQILNGTQFHAEADFEP
jgi:hypothetical protein